MGGAIPFLGVHYEEPPECSDNVLHDYERVFSRLPSLPRPGREGQLKFGPRGIRLLESPEQILVSEDIRGYAGPYYFEFSLAPNRDRALRLDWLVRSRLVAIDGRGRSKGVIAKTKRMLHTVTNSRVVRNGLILSVPDKPGLYRVDTEFESAVSGKRLGRIGQYLRALRPRTAARLAIVGSSTVEPGGPLVVRFENLGTRKLRLPEIYVLDHYKDGYWQLDVGIKPQAEDSLARPIYAGLAAGCEILTIPADAPSGLYRVRTPFAAGPRWNRRVLEAMSEFQVQ